MMAGYEAAAPAGVGHSSIHQGSDHMCPDLRSPLLEFELRVVSVEDEVVQDTGAHGDQYDVGSQMHRRLEATESLRQTSKGILHDTSGTRQPVAVYA